MSEIIERMRKAVEAGRDVTILMMDGSILKLNSEDGRWALVCNVIPTMVYTVRGPGVRIKESRSGVVTISVGRSGTAEFRVDEIENLVVHRAAKQIGPEERERWLRQWRRGTSLFSTIVRSALSSSTAGACPTSRRSSCGTTSALCWG